MKGLGILAFLIGAALVSTVINTFAYTINTNIKVDQFGYKLLDQKIAVISNPQVGYNSANTFSPGAIYQVRRVSDNVSIFSNTISSWNAGVTHSQSGDKAWWFDFSVVATVGSYYLFDPTNNVGSYPFDINDCVYNSVLKNSMRSYFYQRCGFAKTATFAGTGWTDNSCHIGSLQDKDCRLYNNTTVGTSKDLSGGWHDAGDYNKYVNFTWSTLTDLLLGYEENPTVWGDDYNIPESGNGIPDVLDEVKYELDWLLKMQMSNGSVLPIVGGGSASPPSSDGQQRLYGSASTSASYTLASVCALAAIEYNKVGMTAYATTLTNAAINAYNWAVANPGITFYNVPNKIGAGEQELNAYNLQNRQISAAIFLYALTGTATYKTYVESNYTSVHLVAWGYAYPFETTAQDMLLYYTKQSGVNSSVATAILNAYSNSMNINGNSDNLTSFNSQTDAYRAYMSDNNYAWGSNSTKGGQGNMFANMNVYSLNTANVTNYTNAASGFVHYIHGVNPIGIVYLSNMSVAGAEYSVREFYHSWFTNGSVLWDRVGTSTYGPAPGFLVGGPNPSYAYDGCCPNNCGSPTNNALCVQLSPPYNQPVQKSFLEFNTNWPLDSWQVTENGIYYEAAYTRLLSKFCAAATSCSMPHTITQLTVPKQIESVRGNSLAVYPNPTNGEFTLEVTLSVNEQISIRIIDNVGKSYFSNQYLSNTSGVNKVGLSIQDYPSGIYQVIIQTSGDQLVQKVVKL